MFPSRRATLGGDVFRDEFSVSFDGTDEFIDTTFVSNYDVFTISAWINVNTGGIGTNRVIFDGRDDTNDGILFFIGSDEKISLRINSVQVNDPSTITPNVWHHIVGTNDGSTGKLYLNGVQINTNNTSGTTISNITNNAMIGAKSFSSTVSHFNGEISEIAFYNKSLSASEVKTIYNGREPYNHKEGVCSNDLVAWYRMGDGVLDTKQNDHTHTGIIGDENNPTLGSDIFGGKGDFSDPSYWTVSQLPIGTFHSIVEDGVGKFLGTGTFGGIRRDNILTIGKIYRVQVDCISNSGTNVQVNLQNPYPRVVSSHLPLGTFFCFFKATGTTTFQLFAPPPYSETVTIDNVILQEVNGNAGAMRNFDVPYFIGNTP